VNNYPDTPWEVKATDKLHTMDKENEN